MAYPEIPYEEWAEEYRKQQQLRANAARLVREEAEAAAEAARLSPEEERELAARTVRAEPQRYEVTPEIQQNILAAMRGEVPSAAAIQQQAGLEAAQRAAMAQAASMRGISPALAMRGALATQAGLQRGALSEAAALRAQEMAGARGQALGLEQLAGGAYAQQQQQLMQQALAEQQARLAQEQSLLGREYGAEQAELQREAQMQMLIRQLQAQRQGQQQQMFGQILGGALGGLGAALPFLFSDKNLKKDIHKADAASYEFLDALKPKKYEYRLEPNQPVFGVMAQDALKSKIGKTIVDKQAGYLGFDPTRSLGALMAAASSLHQRVKTLEGRK